MSSVKKPAGPRVRRGSESREQEQRQRTIIGSARHMRSERPNLSERLCGVDDFLHLFARFRKCLNRKAILFSQCLVVAPVVPAPTRTIRRLPDAAITVFVMTKFLNQHDPAEQLLFRSVWWRW